MLTLRPFDPSTLRLRSGRATLRAGSGKHLFVSYRAASSYSAPPVVPRLEHSRSGAQLLQQRLGLNLFAPHAEAAEEVERLARVGFSCNTLSLGKPERGYLQEGLSNDVAASTFLAKP